MNKEYEKKVRKTFSTNLKRLIEQKGKDQAYIASICGVSEPAVHYWVKGIKIPRMDKISLIADGLDVDISDLLNEYTVYPKITNNHLKFILFGTTDISDDKLNQVLEYAEFIKNK